MKKKSKYWEKSQVESEDVLLNSVLLQCEMEMFPTMCGKSNVYENAVFLKAHFFGQKFRVMMVGWMIPDCYTNMMEFHVRFRTGGANYNQVVKELHIHSLEKKGYGVALQGGEVYHRSCEAELGASGTFRKSAGVLLI